MSKVQRYKKSRSIKHVFFLNSQINQQKNLWYREKRRIFATGFLNKYSSKRSDFLRFYAYLCHVIEDFFACLETQH